MPAKRGYKRTYKSKGGGLGSLKRDVAKLKRETNKEVHTATTVNPVDPNTTGTTTHVTAIAQGDNINNRNGNQILVKSLRMKGHVSINSTTSTNQFVRFVLVRDNLGSTTAPSIGDVWSTVAIFAAGRNRAQGPQDLVRFTILMDEWVGMSALGWEIFGIDRYITVNSACYFTGTASTDEGKGSIWLMQASNEATNDPVVDMDVVIKWINV